MVMKVDECLKSSSAGVTDSRRIKEKREIGFLSDSFGGDSHRMAMGHPLRAPVIVARTFLQFVEGESGRTWVARS